MQWVQEVITSAKPQGRANAATQWDQYVRAQPECSDELEG
jgi:hypothetical protein